MKRLKAELKQESRGRALPVVDASVTARVRAEEQAARDIIRLPEEPTQGDCVDCNRCVTACPTGIDIRNGLQMECIACAQCIDACDDVMTRIGKPKGLIRYDSMNALEGQQRKKIMRPRLFLYLGILAAATSLLLFFMTSRLPFEANLVRVRGLPFVLTDEGLIRNQLELHLVSKNPEPSTVHVSVEAPVPVKLTMPAVDGKVSLAPTADFRLPIFAAVERANWTGPFDLSVTVRDETGANERVVKARFLGPPK